VQDCSQDSSPLLGGIKVPGPESWLLQEVHSLQGGGSTPASGGGPTTSGTQPGGELRDRCLASGKGPPNRLTSTTSDTKEAVREGTAIA